MGRRKIGRSGGIEDLVIQHTDIVLFWEGGFRAEGGGRLLIEVEGGMGIAGHSGRRGGERRADMEGWPEEEERCASIVGSRSRSR